jgi:hypothetical protein
VNTLTSDTSAEKSFCEPDETLVALRARALKNAAHVIV